MPIEMKGRKHSVWLFFLCWSAALSTAMAPEPNKRPSPAEENSLADDTTQQKTDSFEEEGYREAISQNVTPGDILFQNATFNISLVNCSDIAERFQWNDAGVISTFAVLVLINVLVIGGNILVISAVFSSSKLRSVTNLFIVSLAVADMSLGVMVLPFSITVAVFNTWPFGPIWCSIWLAVDVWLSTASILNLVVISFDRYVAVTRPVSYPSLMTSNRAKILIGAVWVLSFVICFPPLVGWNDKHQNLAMSLTCNVTCQLTQELGYVLYSALGSFFLPMFVMMFFYWKIYLAAAETTKAINQGFRTMTDQNKSGEQRRFQNERVTLRIHRGAHSSSRGRGASNARSHYTAVRKTNSDTSDVQNLYDDPSPIHKEGVELVSVDSKKTKARLMKRPNSIPGSHSPPRFQRESSHSTQAPSGGSDTSGAESSTSCNNGTTSSSNRSASRMGRRNIKNQVKRFRMETKAAKTLGIIVGVFIMCWLPFFCIYLVMGFCSDCINPLLFDILFWLGYCNSAINPFIYALFSKDFRHAFKTILCRCVCQEVKSKRAPLYVPSYGDESEDGK